MSQVRQGNGCNTPFSGGVCLLISEKPEPMKNISVMLVDDHTVVRQGLRALLKSEEDIEVIGLQ